MKVIIIIFFFFFFHGLDRLTCSGIDALPSFLHEGPCTFMISRSTLLRMKSASDKQQRIFVIVEEQETNLTSLVIMFHFTCSMLNMFRTLIHPSSGACKPVTFLLYHHIGRVFLFRCVLEFRCGWVGVVSV